MNVIVQSMNTSKHSEDEFEILRRIDIKNKYSQRQLAKELGFSLGKLNYCIRALRDKGLIKIKNFKKNKNKSIRKELIITLV